jgi:hypothetical protein
VGCTGNGVSSGIWGVDMIMSLGMLVPGGIIGVMSFWVVMIGVGLFGSAVDRVIGGIVKTGS